MRKSLIDSIGREQAYQLMENAVLQAIEENYSFGLVHKAKTVEMAGGVLRIVQGTRQVPLVAGQVEPSASRILNKKVPIA